MDGIGNPFTQNYSNGDNSKTSFSKEQVNSETAKHIYQIPLEVVDHFRRYKRSYAKKLGGLQTIPELLIRGAPRRTPTYI